MTDVTAPQSQSQPPADVVPDNVSSVGGEQPAVAESDPGAYHSSTPPTAAAAYQPADAEDPMASASAVVRLRGLPFSSTVEDIRKFAKGYIIREPDGILVLLHGDRRGEGFIEFVDTYEAQRFHVEKDRHTMGERYIEVYMSYPEDMEAALADEEASGSLTKNPIVRLRGLPFATTDEDLMLFFSQCQQKIVNIRFVEDIQGRRTGDAFLELADEDAVSIAMTKHRLLMGTRYVEVSRTTAPDREAVLHVASRRGRGGAPVVPQHDFQRMGFDPSLMIPPMFNPLLFMPPPLVSLAGPDGLVSVQIGKEAAEQAAAAQAAKTQAFAMMQSSMLGGLASMSGANGNPHPHGGRRGKNRQQQQQQIQEAEVPAEGEEPTAEVGAYSSARPDAASRSAGPPAIVPPSPLMPPSPPRAQSRYIVRVRGLPFSATEETVAEFFNDVNVQPQGVHMVYNSHDKPTGEAFVEVESDADVLRALDHNGGALGHRYIEVFKSGPADMQRLGGGPQAGNAPPGLPPNGGYPPFDMMMMGAAGMFPPGMMPMFPPFGFPPPQWGWGYQ